MKISNTENSYKKVFITNPNTNIVKSSSIQQESGKPSIIPTESVKPSRI